MIRKPEACRGCVLWGNGYGFSLLEGSGEIPLLVLAEALGRSEENDALPLRPYAPAGAVFTRALRELGQPRSTDPVHTRPVLTNILRCRPPDNELRGAVYYREAVDHCAVHLRAALRQAEPRAILTLGDIPYWETVVDKSIGTVSAVRGFVLPSVHNIPLVATYHPMRIGYGQWNLFGAFKRDVAFALRIAQQGVPPQLETTYELEPTVSRVRDYLSYLQSAPNLAIAYDVETAHILGEREPEDWRAKRIVQIQFSHRSGYAIVLPYSGEYRLLAHAILALPNAKWGWNSRLSDDLALQSDGAVLGGELHDLMNAWGHLQPNFWGGKEDRDTDKDVPSRLMGLQSAASFYCPEVGPWKHLGDAEHLQLYGAMDADYTHRVGEGVFASLEAQGLMEGYRNHKIELRPVLDLLGEVGLPVDGERQQSLRNYVVDELSSLQGRISALVPAEVLSVHPKSGYKQLSTPVQVTGSTNGKTPLRDLIAAYDEANPPLIEAAGHVGYLKQRDFIVTPPVTLTGEYQEIPVAIEKRWCIERLYNPHGSSPNTKSYIRHRGYRMPVKIDDPSVETTGKSELAKLARETGDEVLRLTQEWREFAKGGMDYTSPKWAPGTDGRVHASFKWGTASGQLVATDPPVMTYPEHSGLAKRVKEVIRAEPGHVLVKVDMRGFHARAIGWLAGDPAYYRLADFDVHSFIAAHFLQLPGAGYLIDQEDAELRESLGIIKHLHTDTRNYKVKRVVHGRQFGLGLNKLYLMYSGNFDPTPEQLAAVVGERWHSWNDERRRKEIAHAGRTEATNLYNLFDRLFPRTFVAFPQWVEAQIHNRTKCRLVSPFAHHRYFYDWDLQQATAYLPSNCAHCHFQAAMVRLHRSGALQRFEVINSTHDALWFHPKAELAAECISAVQYEFERPSEVLVDSPLGPFYCHSDAESGPDLASMEECTS